MRVGILPQELRKGLEGKRPIWLHAVSVGEMKASGKLLEELHKEYPDREIVISTVTPTGNKIAKALAGKKDLVFYLPLDVSFIVRNVVRMINPSLLVIAETEIWPNLISCLYRQKVPIITVNARISNKSFVGYKVIKFLLKPILNKIHLFCVQTKTDAERLQVLGVAAEKIKITGNMKFDSTDYTDFPADHVMSVGIPLKREKADYTDYRLKLGLNESDKFLVAGSTHPGEEEIIVAAYKEALMESPYLKLLIAPRHPERAKDIGKLVSRNNFNPVFISGIPACLTDRQACLREDRYPAIFILDTIGQLMPFYAIADIVFVGGSLIKKGGQNPLEPAAFAKPILFGPYMFNFRDIAQLYIKNNACIVARNRKELLEAIKDLLNNPSKARVLGSKAKDLIIQNQGATKKNMEWIGASQWQVQDE